jgi:hypothetical protein
VAAAKDPFAAVLADRDALLAAGEVRRELPVRTRASALEAQGRAALRDDVFKAFASASEKQAVAAATEAGMKRPQAATSAKEAASEEARKRQRGAASSSSASSSSSSAPPASLAAAAEKRAELFRMMEGSTPIILVPPSSSSPITIFNAQRFFGEGVWEDPVVSAPLPLPSPLPTSPLSELPALQDSHPPHLPAPPRV